MTTNEIYSEIFYAKEAEEAVIGSVLSSSGRTFPLLQEMLHEEDFWSIRHRIYWQIFQRLASRQDPIDVTLVSDEMMRLDKDKLEMSGGPAYIMHLLNNTPTSWHAEAYAERVLETSVRRQGAEMADKTRQAMMDQTLNPRQVLAVADRDLMLLRQRTSAMDTPKHDMEQFTTVLHEMLHDGEERTKQNPLYVIGVRTGITDLDDVLDGLRPGITTLAAATGMGKTALALQITRYAALHGFLRDSESPAKVHFFSGEMTDKQLGVRMLSGMTGVPARYIERGAYNAEQKKLLHKALVDLHDNYKLSLEPGARINTGNIRQRVRSMVNNNEMDLLVLDGLLQIEGIKLDERDSQRRQNYVKQQRRDLIEDIMNDLEDIALSYGIPILMTHQLSRAAAGRSEKRPILSDLAEANFVEQKSAVILFLYRDGYYNPLSENPNSAEIIVAKNRHGNTAIIDQYYDAQYTRFLDADKVSYTFGR
jgi:replicative DNA helicase